MNNLTIENEVTRYQYRGFTFLHYTDGEVEMISPEYYDVGYSDEVVMNLEIRELKEFLLSGIIDLYDFGNRDLQESPIEKAEVAQIQRSFSEEEITLYFPQIKRT